MVRWSTGVEPTLFQDATTGGQGCIEPAILSDPRLRGLVWRDLVHVSRWEIIRELSLPAPWLLSSWWLAAHRHFGVALLASFLFFLTGLRLVHNAFHHSIGVSRRATDAVLWIMSGLMLGSMHAVRFNHLRHHKHLMDEHDVEGRSAELSALGALAYGPIFPVLLHAAALSKGNRALRFQVLGELLLTILLVAATLGYLDLPWLRYHVIAMAAGQCLTAFFAVWTVHHHCDRAHYIARTLRNRVKNVLTYHMFLHIEHHLFPRVPTVHLTRLSERIDRVAPELKGRIVF